MCEYRLPLVANIEPLCGISIAPLAQISIYKISPHPPPTRRRSPFSTKLGKAERAKVDRVRRIATTGFRVLKGAY